MLIQYLSKSLSAPSSNGVGSISTAVPSVVTLNTSNLDTGRRIVFTSTADASSLTLTFTGRGEGSGNGYAITEAVSGSTASGIQATTFSDFMSVSSVSLSSNVNIPILIGTSSVGGTPWSPCNCWLTPMDTGAALRFSSTAVGLTGGIEITMDDPTRTYPNPYFTVPYPFRSTSPVSQPSSIMASSNSWGAVNVDANRPVPVTATRLTITSSGTGTVYATIMQAGVVA